MASRVPSEITDELQAYFNLCTQTSQNVVRYAKIAHGEDCLTVEALACYEKRVCLAIEMITLLIQTEEHDIRSALIFLDECFVLQLMMAIYNYFYNYLSLPEYDDDMLELYTRTYVYTRYMTSSRRVPKPFLDWEQVRDDVYAVIEYTFDVYEHLNYNMVALNEVTEYLDTLHKLMGYIFLFTMENE